MRVCSLLPRQQCTIIGSLKLKTSKHVLLQGPTQQGREDTAGLQSLLMMTVERAAGHSQTPLMSGSFASRSTTECSASDASRSCAT